MAKDILARVLVKKWHFYVSRKFNWFVENTQIIANKKSTLEETVGFDVSQENYLVLNGDEYYTDAESEKFNNTFDKLMVKNRNFFKEFASSIISIGKKVNNYRLETEKTDFKKLTYEELVKKIEDFQGIYTLSFVPAFTRPDDYLEVRTKALIKRDLKLRDVEVEDWFGKVATYPKIGELAYNDEPLKLLEIAKDLKAFGYKPGCKVPPEMDKKIDLHVQKYRWMKAPVASGEEAFEKADYLERIDNMMTKDIDAQIKRIENLRVSDEGLYQELIKTPGLKADTINLINAVRDFIYLRTYTTEASDELFYTAKLKLFKEVANRLDLSLSEVVMLSSDEMVLGLKGQFGGKKRVITDRLTGFAIVWLESDCVVRFGKEALELQDSVSKKVVPVVSNKNIKVSEIRGRTASLGKVIGKVKVLLDHRDAHKVDKGDVLVASMTTPDYVLAMEKAIAFVTDEGGITCHAAIVAREFGVPCIVGTGNATKVLHDNQVVEVDANEGVVRIIS